MLEQNKEKRAKDPTLRQRFNTSRFGDRKEAVVNLLQRVTTVSVQTAQIVEMMKRAAR